MSKFFWGSMPQTLLVICALQVIDLPPLQILYETLGTWLGRDLLPEEAYMGEGVSTSNLYYIETINYTL